MSSDALGISGPGGPAGVPWGLALFLLRLLFLALLYLFIFRLLSAIVGDLRRLAPGVANGGAMGRLVVLDAASSNLSQGQVIPLPPVATVGRSPQNHIVVEDEFVSAFHALFSHRGGRWWLRDQQSTNGTYLNGSLVQGEVPIEYSDRLRIGSVELELAP